MKKAKTFPQPAERNAVLIKHRNNKMAKSAHAYMRGATDNFYEWLQTVSPDKLPEGPPIWICGDCHIGNLGPVADKEGKVEFLIRDFDQTVIGNPAHDLIRLGLSLAFTARGSNLPGILTAHMLKALMNGYTTHLLEGEEIKTKMPAVIKAALKTARKRTWKELFKERLTDTSPTIPFGKKYWPVTHKEARDISAIFTKENAINLVNRIRSKASDNQLEVSDSAVWVKGCSSLGLMRYAVLLSIKDRKTSESEFCLMDIKEAVGTKARQYSDTKMPVVNAKRVIDGARHLSPYLGERMIATQVLGHSVFVRELRPQDIKLKINSFRPKEALEVANYFGATLGRAHGRQMNADTRQQWCRDAIRYRLNDGIQSWLWRCTVELVALHEAAYLEHCRRYVEDRTK
ncbi:MAG: hypothetical protein K0S63_10 [Gammaproteobacteria bacterium]|jgi:uncharacterized protein (DUF2252 family)|nr:hypothetical protein [Gammaproteobacteria bacterium]